MLKFLILISFTLCLDAKIFSFVAVGDTPYSLKEEEILKDKIIPSIEKLNTPFVVFYGDLKSGSESCTDELIQDRYKLVMSMHENVFYTPGDNEWTDCDRVNLETRFSELERLDYLKKIFFSRPLELKESWEYKRQSNFEENVMWQYNNIQFATIHLVSTNNGRQEILKDDIELALSLVETRDQANRVWLKRVFENAVKNQKKAIIISTQADVTNADGSGACTENNMMNCDAFANFNANLRNFSKKVNIPVLLIHGDTNPYCIDSKFGQGAKNLWRLNGWGDFKSPADATVVSVNLDSKIPFSAKTLLGGTVAQECY